MHELVVTWLAMVFRNWLGTRGGFVFGSDAKFIASAKPVAASAGPGSRTLLGPGR